MRTNSLRLETKNEPEATDVEAAIAKLNTAFDTKMAAFTTDLKAANDNLAAQKKRADDLEVRLNRPGTAAANDNEPTAETKAFETFIRKGREGLGEEVKSLRVSDDTAGGFIAPDEFQKELDRNIRLFSPIRDIARVMPMGGPAVLWPKRVGGLTGTWTGEVTPRTESTVTFGQSRYAAFEIAAYVDVSNAMLEDSTFDIGQLLAFEAAEEFGVKEGTAFVNGASALQPAGFMQDANVAYTPGTDASLIKADGLIDLYHAVKPAYRGNGYWLMNSTTLGAIRKLKDTSSGQYLISMQGLNNTPVTTLLGRPVVETTDMADIGSNAFPVAFGNFEQGYRIFDRLALSILRDPYSQATNGMTRFHMRRRVAGGVGKAEAIRKLKIATS